MVSTRRMQRAILQGRYIRRSAQSVRDLSPAVTDFNWRSRLSDLTVLDIFILGLFKTNLHNETMKHQ